MASVTSTAWPVCPSGTASRWHSPRALGRLEMCSLGIGGFRDVLAGSCCAPALLMMSSRYCSPSATLCPCLNCSVGSAKLSFPRVSPKSLFAKGLSCSPGVSRPSSHLSCQDIQTPVLIWSVVATSPGKVNLNQPPAGFAALIWSIFCPPAALITLSMSVHDAASHSRFCMCSVV